MQIIRQRAHARVGLIGNPSDGYGGKTIAFTLNEFAARVVLYPWDQLEIIQSEQDKSRFSSIDDLVENVNLNGYYGAMRLVKATIKCFIEFCRAQGFDLHDRPFSIRYETNIPRGVGLAGSSAIVVATLRCLMEYFETTIPLHLQPSLARSVENDELGIACGYQDRVAQVYEGLVCMDFSSMQPLCGLEYGQYERLMLPSMPSVYVLYDLTSAKTSGAVHGPLRNRVEDDSRLSETMSEIAELVPQAREAMEQRDWRRLHKLIDRNFDLRCRLYDIRPAHRQMIEAARSVGASAKFAGSGGAIVGTFLDEATFQTLKTQLVKQNENWRVIRPVIQNSE